MINRYDVIGTKVSEVDVNTSTNFVLDSISKTKNTYICCANAHTVVTAYENDEYRKILNESLLTLPDGKPIANVGIKKHLNVKKVSGVDFIETVLEKTANTNIKHFFYGNTKEYLNKFINTIKSKYPNLKIVGYEESLFRDLTDIEKEELKNRIISSNADFVWVALGAPRQESFCAKMCKNTNACFIAVGGAFNVIAGIVPRAPKWMQNHSLEWLYRLLKEPKRLFKRYAITNSKYLIYRFFSNER